MQNTHSATKELAFSRTANILVSNPVEYTYALFSR